MVGRCRSTIARVCALLLLLQALAAAMATGRAVAAQIDPLAGIPICASNAAVVRDSGFGVPAHRDRGHHCLDECCLAGSCPAALVAVIAQLRDVAVPRDLSDSAVLPVRLIGSNADRPADRFQARAPPLSL
ncbi:MAG: hypothetical protein U1E53_11810 [Dongiaceae bacterium]